MNEYKITLHDPDASYLDLVVWAKRRCQSYHRSNHTDVSDISMTVDVIYEFWFSDQKDATMFYLRWS